MKFVSLIVGLVAFALLIGCGVSEQSLVGTWEPTVEVAGDEDGDSFASRVANGFSDIAGNQLELRADKTCTFKTLGLGVDGTWELVEGEVKVSDDSGKVAFTFTVSEDGKQLSTSGASGKLVFGKIDEK